MKMRTMMIFGLLIFFLFDTATAQFSLYLEQKIPLQSEHVSCLKINSEGRFLAIGARSGNVYLFDISAKKLIRRFKAHTSQINGLVFDAKNQYLISGSDDKKIIVWDLYTGQVVSSIGDFKASILSVDLSPDDRLLAAAGDRDEIGLWDFPAGAMRGLLKGHRKGVIALSFSLSGDQLLSVGKDNLMIVWDVAKQQPVRKSEIASRTMNNSGIEVRSAAFSPDKYFVGVGMQERVLAKGGRQMIFKYNLGFYEWKTGSEIEVIQGNKCDINFFAISPDKNYAITDNSTLRQNRFSIWNIKTGVIDHNQPIDGKICAIEIALNGKWLAVAYDADGNTSAVNLWQISGIDGYQRFAMGAPIKSEGSSGFGAAMKITTPQQPLI